MDNDELNELLIEIFGPDAGFVGATMQHAKMSPSLTDIIEFAKLLKGEHPERVFQEFLTEHPEFLAGVAGYASDNDIAFLTHPRAGNRIADFGVIGVGQGGVRVEMIEIKKAHENLFTRDGTETMALRKATSQGRNYERLIGEDRRRFFLELLAGVKDLPVWPSRSADGSFRYVEGAHSDHLMERYGDGAAFFLGYTVIIGRWSRLSTDHRRHLLGLSQHNAGACRILTYEHFARRAYSRMLMGNYENTER